MVSLVPRTAQAQASSAMELFQVVNEMRASYGLAAYQLDANLTSIAQSHSDYMASILEYTHTRADGSGPGDYGITAENIGGGLNATAHHVVYNQWSDTLHTNTIIGYSEAMAGVGATVKDGLVFYTLVVKRTGGFTNLANTQAAPGVTPGQATSLPARLATVTLATAMVDGTLMHIIQPGETLWAIAISYGVTIADLAILNPGLSAENPLVRPGQKIIIRAGFTPTVSPTITETPIPATATPRLTSTLRPTRTITTTPTLTKAPLLPEIPSWGSGQVRPLGITIIVICALGLLGILVSILRKG